MAEEALQRHAWTPEEQAEICECFLNRLARITNTVLTEEDKAFDTKDGVIVATWDVEASGRVMIGKPKPSEEQAMAEAERKEVKVDSTVAA